MAFTTRKSTIRKAVTVAIVIAWAGLAAAQSFWPSSLPKRPGMYWIEGYLGQAPEKASVVDHIELSHQGRQVRAFAITQYRTPGETSLDLHLSRHMSPRYALEGSEDEVRRLFDAPKGAHVRGTFIAYRSGAPVLVIGELDLPAPKPSTDAEQARQPAA